VSRVEMEQGLCPAPVHLSTLATDVPAAMARDINALGAATRVGGTRVM